MNHTVDKWITQKGENAEYVAKLGHGGYGEVHRVCASFPSTLTYSFAIQLLLRYNILYNAEFIMYVLTFLRISQENSFVYSLH
jgi:hypothetical protein